MVSFVAAEFRGAKIDKMNLHDLHLIGIELRSCPMGAMLVAIFVIAKEMILTHGECERSSIVLGVLSGGWYEEAK